MAVTPRLQWVLQQLQLGRQSRVRLNTYTDLLIVHIVMLPTYQPSMANTILSATIGLLLNEIDNLISIDRGHLNSAGECCICIKLKPARDRQRPQADADEPLPLALRPEDEEPPAEDEDDGEQVLPAVLHGDAHGEQGQPRAHGPGDFVKEIQLQEMEMDMGQLSALSIQVAQFDTDIAAFRAAALAYDRTDLFEERVRTWQAALAELMEQLPRMVPSQVTTSVKKLREKVGEEWKTLTETPPALTAPVASTRTAAEGSQLQRPLRLNPPSRRDMATSSNKAKRPHGASSSGQGGSRHSHATPLKKSKDGKHVTT